MRHSFLPSQDQKALKKRYRLHATVVALFLLSVVGIIGIGSLFPAYVEVSFEERDQNASLKDGADKEGVQSIADIISELQSDAILTRELSNTLTEERSSDFIKEVISARASVKVHSISIPEVSTTSAVIVIQGIAPTRESLVSFKTRLEGLANGNKVELPISELAKSKDIPFSFKFTRLLP
ncbi:MAG: hypothetical protein RLY66_108 [Candidatus Parcubacteria bacterium]|jgi:hypothetical protein